METVDQPLATFQNAAQGLSLRFPASWSFQTISAEPEKWTRFSDGPMASLQFNVFTLPAFSAKWQFTPQSPLEALNPYLVFQNRREAHLHESLDSRPLNGLDSFSITYSERPSGGVGVGGAGSCKAAVLHDEQVLIIEAAWETAAHEDAISQILATLKVGPPTAAELYQLQLHHLVNSVDEVCIREVQLPYPLRWDLAYQPATLRNVARFSLNDELLLFHYFLDLGQDNEAAGIPEDNQLAIARLTKGLDGPPLWPGTTTEENIALHTASQAAEGLLRAQEQSLYLLADVGHARFIRDWLSLTRLNSQPVTSEISLLKTSLASINITPKPEQSGALDIHTPIYYELELDQAEVVADGQDKATAVLTVRNRFWQPVSNQEIHLEAEGSVSIEQEALRTGAAGQITATIQSDIPQNVTLYPFSGDGVPLPAAANLTFIPLPDRYELSVGPEQVWAGVDEAIVLLSAQKGDGTPLAGQPIEIRARPEVRIDQPEKQTNAAGRVHALIQSAEPVAVEVFAVADDGQILAPAQTVSFVAAIDKQNSELLLDEDEAPTTGEDVVNITLIVRDAAGRSLPGREIELKTSPALAISQPQTMTDGDGRLQATLRSQEPMTVTVTAVDKRRQSRILSRQLRLLPPLDPLQTGLLIDGAAAETTETENFQASLAAELAALLEETPPGAFLGEDRELSLVPALDGSREQPLPEPPWSVDQDAGLEGDIEPVPALETSGTRHLNAVPPPIIRQEPGPAVKVISPPAPEVEFEENLKPIPSRRPVFWLGGVLMSGLVLAAFLWCTLAAGSCGPCQFWRSCRQQPFTAEKGPPVPIITLQVAGPVTLSDDGLEYLVPVQAVGRVFREARAEETPLAGQDLGTLLATSYQTAPADTPVRVEPGSVASGEEPDSVTFDLALPSNLVGEEVQLNTISKGYWSSLPIRLQTMPLVQINAPHAPADLTYDFAENEIIVRVDGQVTPAEVATHWEFSLLDPTTLTSFDDTVHRCDARQGFCHLPFDYSHPCLALDVQLVADTPTGALQTGERISDCPKPGP